MNTRTTFSYDDPRAPRSPWGKVDSLCEIQRGVRWVGTPSHGGLGVAVGVARKTLSPAAIACGMEWGGYLWFEEDCGCNIAFHERPDWHAAVGFVDGWTRADVEASVRRHTPEYFDFVEGRRPLPRPVFVGAVLKALRDFKFSNGFAVPAGESFTVERVKGANMVARASGFAVSLPKHLLGESLAFV